MFDEGAVRRRLASTRFRRLHYVAETDSTNDDAAASLGNAARAGSLFIADYQRHGRGRRGRRWLAPPGSALLFTATLPQPVRTSALWVVPFWCALAITDGIRSYAGIELALQWPNDLLLGEGKVCGILGTSRVAGDLSWVGCGIGMNVHRPRRTDRLVDPYVAYLSDAATAPKREDVLVAIATAMSDNLPSLDDDPVAVARTWERRAHVPGERYRIQVDGEPAPLEGRALRLERDGALVISTGGVERRVTMADARVLRSS